MTYSGFDDVDLILVDWFVFADHNGPSVSEHVLTSLCHFVAISTSLTLFYERIWLSIAVFLNVISNERTKDLRMMQERRKEGRKNEREKEIYRSL